VLRPPGVDQPPLEQNLDARRSRAVSRRRRALRIRAGRALARFAVNQRRLVQAPDSVTATLDTVAQLANKPLIN
jgi:hypothetical protein